VYAKLQGHFIWPHFCAIKDEVSSLGWRNFSSGYYTVSCKPWPVLTVFFHCPTGCHILLPLCGGGTNSFATWVRPGFLMECCLTFPCPWGFFSSFTSQLHNESNFFPKSFSFLQIKWMTQILFCYLSIKLLFILFYKTVCVVENISNNTEK
jgi:hypothetical protein